MSGIVRRLEWDRQPRISGRPNVANSVASALGALLRFDEFGIFDVAGSIGFQPATQFTRHSTTHGIGYGRTTYGYGQPAVASPFGTGPFSAVVLAAPTSAAAITPFFSWRDDGGGEQCSFAANTDAGFAPAAGSVTMTTATGLVLESPGALTGVTSVYGFSVTSASSGVIYVDGAAKPTNAYNSGLLTAPPRPFYIASHLGSVSVHSEPIYFIATFNRSLSPAEHAALARSLYHLYEPEQILVPMAAGATNYPATATDALTLGDSASNVASLSASNAAALTLSDAASNVAALSATATDAMTFSDSASNVAALSAARSEAMTLADTASDVMGAAASATEAVAMAASQSAAMAATSTVSEAMTLADAVSNVAALSAAQTEAATLADTVNGSASGDYIAVSTEAMALADAAILQASLSAAASEAMTLAANATAVANFTLVSSADLALADALAAVKSMAAAVTEALALDGSTSASMSGDYVLSASDALVLADQVSNQAALSASITASLTLAELITVLNSGATLGDASLRVRVGASEWSAAAAPPMTVRARGIQ